MKEQKRARRIAMTKDELDAFLGEEWMCRLGSVDGPRADEPNRATAAPEQLWADKYTAGRFHPDGKHAWVAARARQDRQLGFSKAR
jgi:hypothetical protein